MTSLRRIAAAVTGAALATLGSLVGAAALSPAAAAPLPVIYSSGSDSHVWEQNTGSDTIYLRFERYGELTVASSVTLTIVDGTATRGSDYTAPTYSKVLNFPVGEDFVAIPITIKGDTATEPDETFSFHLTDPVGATIYPGNESDTVTIGNDDSDLAPRFFIDDVFSPEGDAGTSQWFFTVRRWGSTAAPASVKVATTNGTAVAPGDYTTKYPTRISLAIGQVEKTVAITVKGDLAPEDDEWFYVNLSAPVGATIGDSFALGVLDNDDSSATPSFTVGSEYAEELLVEEGDGYARTLGVRIRRDGNLQNTVKVRWSTQDGTAVAPSDYVAKAPTWVTFLPGQTEKTVTVSIRGGTVYEALEEQFSVLLTDPVGGVIADGTAVITIIDDDRGEF